MCVCVCVYRQSEKVNTPIATEKCFFLKCNQWLDTRQDSKINLK